MFATNSLEPRSNYFPISRKKYVRVNKQGTPAPNCKWSLVFIEISQTKTQHCQCLEVRHRPNRGRGVPGGDWAAPGDRLRQRRDRLHHHRGQGAQHQRARTRHILPAARSGTTFSATITFFGYVMTVRVTRLITILLNNHPGDIKTLQEDKLRGPGLPRRVPPGLGRLLLQRVHLQRLHREGRRPRRSRHLRQHRPPHGRRLG